MRSRTLIPTAMIAVVVLFGVPGDAPSPRAPSPRAGDVAVSIAPPTPLDYSIYMPRGYREGQPYPVVVGMFDSSLEHRLFLELWEETYGSLHPFYYVVPRTPAGEVTLPAYSMSASRYGVIPLTRVGMTGVRESLVEMVERMGRRHRIAGAFMVTSQGMERLDVPTLLSDHWMSLEF